MLNYNDRVGKSFESLSIGVYECHTKTLPRREQIWQDQWHVLGTYGTWSLLGLHTCAFLVSQFFHYRREARKLKHLETLVKGNVAWA
jgi:hypothetical protein